MRQIGKYTGKIYEDSETIYMKECGIVISDKEQNNDELIKRQYFNNAKRCMMCNGCLESRRSNPCHHNTSYCDSCGQKVNG